MKAMPMVELLNQAEREFGIKVLSSQAARAFYRTWRRGAGGSSKAWSQIRDAAYFDAGKKVVGVALVSALRQHLSDLQSGRCCYCRRALQGIAYAQPIEHVLSRTHYPQYTFFYRNLALSCFDCNHSKKAKNWTSWPKGRRNYLPLHRCGQFFHPRLHKYDEHVRFVRLETNGAAISFYVGLTTQGKQICRDLLQHTAGRELAVSANERIAQAMEKLKVQVDRVQSAKTAEDLATFIEALDELALPSS
jgi:uncharacterized protein (TIGR02646 family)